MHVIADIIVIDVYVTMQEFIVTELRVYSTALIHLTCDWTQNQWFEQTAGQCFYQEGTFSWSKRIQMAKAT